MRGPALAFQLDSANYFTEFGIDLRDHPRVKAAEPLQFSSSLGTLEKIEGAVRKLFVKDAPQCHPLGDAENSKPNRAQHFPSAVAGMWCREV